MWRSAQTNIFHSACRKHWPIWHQASIFIRTIQEDLSGAEEMPNLIPFTEKTKVTDIFEAEVESDYERLDKCSCIVTDELW